ncbi:MAG: Na+/H+ antiporter NhaC family protein [Longimicrobiales bacterium]
MVEPGWLSLVPSLLAIILAIASRQVYLSLAAGVWAGWTILSAWNPLTGATEAIEATVRVLSDEAGAKVIVTTLVFGALVATIEAGNRARSVVPSFEDGGLLDSPRRVQLLAWVTALVLFVDARTSVLVAGTIGRPLFDRFRVSREKLAYIIDATSASATALIPLNMWAAYVIGMLAGLSVEDPVGVFLTAIPLNFYAIATAVLAVATIMFSIELGPMKRAEERTRNGELLWDDATPMIDPGILLLPNGAVSRRAANVIVPVSALVMMMLGSLYVTGEGDVRAGSAPTSLLRSVLVALFVACILLLAQRACRVHELTRVALHGAGAAVRTSFVLLLALALAGVANQLGIGDYIAGFASPAASPFLFLPLVFLAGAGIAFATGTALAAVVILLPIVVPVATTLGLSSPPFVAASLAGGVFGQHASPISGTTILASMATATDHIDHVRTQLPYTMIAAAVAVAGYALVGWLL